MTAVFDTSTREATPRQISYALDLVSKFNDLNIKVTDTAVNATLAAVVANDVDGDNHLFISFDEISHALDVIVPLVRDAQNARNRRSSGVAALQTQLKTLHTGRYALPRKSDGVVDAFEIVERPDGRRFLNQLLGGSVAGGKFHRKTLSVELQGAAARAIAADVTSAALLYARTYAECPRCGVALTHPRSKTAGIGKVCAGEWGWTW